MSVDLTKYKDQLFSIHILDQGVSIFSEKFSDFLNIDDVLVFGFISALYSYTYAIGHEEVNSIDFGTCKFLFSPLFDGKLLVIIANENMEREKEEELIENISLRYEILTENQPLESIKSFVDIEDTIIPLKLVAEIRKKRQKKQEPTKMEDLPRMPEISVPEVKIEEFYVEVLTDEKQLSSEKVNEIKKTLTSFFLGYKKLIASLFAVAKKEQLFSFVFSRKNFIEIYPLVDYIIKNPSEIKIDADKPEGSIKPVKVESERYWLLAYMSKKQTTKAVVFSSTKDELDSIAPHLRRISQFVEKMI